ncbi:MAG: 2-C-methyl-D-erythritol 2,4-cyclodiphosphate synthase [Peptostreptococcaceae bacterium]
MRMGTGYDVHKLVEDRDLIMGGVNVPHEKGLLGHSDADVLTHAVMDSILGALALGDIGKHFPDTDEKYKGADSIKLLEYVNQLINEKGYKVNNIDCTIIAQSPKMAPHIQQMRGNFAKVLNTDIDRINVKATTEEGLGFTGSKEGIAAQSVCTIVKVDK